MDSLLSDTRSHMQKAFEVLQTDFSTIRTGKANPSLLENIQVPAYEGTILKLMELATISISDASTMIVTPFDQSVIASIEKAIRESNLGFNPAVSGHTIRVTTPPLTEERRKEFVKVVHQKAENGRVMIRQARHEAMQHIDRAKKDDSISEDEESRLEKEIQKMTDEYVGKIDNLRVEKEVELMRI